MGMGIGFGAENRRKSERRMKDHLPIIGSECSDL
jgi:hypothetical protein